VRLRPVAAIMAAVLGVAVAAFFVIHGLNRPQSAQSPIASVARLNGTPTATRCTAAKFDAGTVTSPAALLSRVMVTSNDVTIFVNLVRAGRVEIRPQAGTKFTQSPSDVPITLAGREGILVTIRGLDPHTQFVGRSDIFSDGPNLVEVRKVQDFEGVVQVALGINGPACYSAAYESYVGGAAIHVAIPVSSPLLVPPDVRLITASGCSGPNPATQVRPLGNYTLRLASGWADTGNDNPTESRVIELAAPIAYGDAPTLLQLHQFIGPVSTLYGKDATAHTVALREAASHLFTSPLAETSSVGDCTVGGDPAALWGYSDGGQVGYWILVVHKDLLHGIRLLGANGISDQAVDDALGMIGSISWNF